MVGPRQTRGRRRIVAPRTARTATDVSARRFSGGRVCTHHGGNAPAVKAKARQRLEEAADRMARELLKMATDENVAASVKLAAIRDALDRAGLAARTAVSVEVGPPKPYEVIFDSIEAGSRAEYRRSQRVFDDNEGKTPPGGEHRGSATPIDVEIVHEPEGRAIETNRRTIRHRST